MTDRYVEGHWIDDIFRDSLRWIPSGVYDDTKLYMPDNYPEGSYSVPLDHFIKAIPLLESHRIITPRLDERLRTEDLKITHRLIDLLDKVATQ